MDILFPILLGVHIVVGLGIIGLVLIQHGKGADMGAAFGSGTSGSIFGATGSANFLSRTTAVFATIFFLTSLGLSYVATNAPRKSESVLDTAKPAAPVSAPATALPAAPAAPVKQDEVPK